MKDFCPELQKYWSVELKWLHQDHRCVSGIYFRVQFVLLFKEATGGAKSYMKERVGIAGVGEKEGNSQWLFREHMVFSLLSCWNVLTTELCSHPGLKHANYLEFLMRWTDWRWWANFLLATLTFWGPSLFYFSPLPVLPEILGKWCKNLAEVNWRSKYNKTTAP